ncbi:MAG: CDP-alcohol phosphatidyltransferase family protein [Oleiphilaceae bacterium]|nr:CDP-alcohol phosphatidyltransferase family protein [Oleiphilaceae bacterium]
MDSYTSRWKPPLPDLLAGALALLMLCGLTATAVDLPLTAITVAMTVYIAIGSIAYTGWRRSHEPAGAFGWANRVTLLRALLTCWLAALLPYPELMATLIWPYVIISLVNLILDGVDGGIARITRSTSAFGARFDMELDAFFLLVLCGALLSLDKTGAWVLALGLLRYGFLMASAIWPWLQRPLPDSFRRKTVCVWQGATLLIALAPFTGSAFASLILAVAVSLLIYSFGADTWWLFRQRTVKPGFGAEPGLYPTSRRPGNSGL